MKIRILHHAHPDLIVAAIQSVIKGAENEDRPISAINVVVNIDLINSETGRPLELTRKGQPVEELGLLLAEDWNPAEQPEPTFSEIVLRHKRGPAPQTAKIYELRPIDRPAQERREQAN